jgi:prephenate dehydrogenase
MNINHLKEMGEMPNQTIHSYVDVLAHTQQLAESLHDTAEGYTKMARTLTSAVDTLESTASHVQCEVMTALTQFIEEADATPNFYTDHSWDAYMNALHHAKAIQQGRKSKLVEILKAKNDLRKAKTGLVYDPQKI